MAGMCPHCGHELPMEACAVCSHCGGRLSASDAEPRSGESTSLVYCQHCEENVEVAADAQNCPVCGRPFALRLEAPPAAGMGVLVGRANPMLLVSAGLGLLVAVVLNLTLRGLVQEKSWLGTVLYPEGGTEVIPWAILLLLFWGGVWLGMAAWLVRQERRMLRDDFVAVLRQDLRRNRSEAALERLFALRDDGMGIVLTRLRVALAEWQRSRSVDQVRASVNDRAMLDADALEGSMNIIRILIWAAPILGFIGTVLGISFAIGDFSAFISASGGEAMQMADVQMGITGVTSGLALAFNTTLVGLVVALFLMVPLSMVQRSQDDLLADTHEAAAEIMGLLHLGDVDVHPRPPDRTSIGAAELAAAMVSLDEVAQRIAAVESALLQHHAYLTRDAEALEKVEAGLGEWERSQLEDQRRMTEAMAGVHESAAATEEVVRSLPDLMREHESAQREVWTGVSSTLGALVSASAQQPTRADVVALTESLAPLSQLPDILRGQQESQREGWDRLLQSLEALRSAAAQQPTCSDLAVLAEKVTDEFGELATRLNAISGPFELRLVAQPPVRPEE